MSGAPISTKFAATGATNNVGQTYAAGIYRVSVTYTPTDQPNAHSTLTTSTQILQASPVVTLAVPPALLPGLRERKEK